MDKIQRKLRRKKSIRKKVSGTVERPRMCIQKSNRFIYAQIIDDTEGKTICGISTKSSDINEKAIKTCKNLNFAKKLGQKIAENAKEKGVKKIVFDRSGYQYHGVIKMFCEAARENGLEF